MAKLTILLPSSRDRCGRGAVISSSGRVLLGPFRVLGTASRYTSSRHGNPTCDRRLPFGDPPTGRFRIVTFLPPGSTHPRRPGRFGRLGALVAQPEAGEALEAAQHGRDRIVLHGGAEGTSGRLRRTRGGLRVGDRDLSLLFAAINRAQANGDPVSELEITDVPQLATVGDGRPARGRAVRRADGRRAGGTASKPRAASDRGAVQAAAVGALALFGVTKASPTRRAFLRGAALALLGLQLPACDRPAPAADCIPPNCDPTVDVCPPVPCDYGDGVG